MVSVASRVPAMNSVGLETIIAVAMEPAGLMEARVAMICLGSRGRQIFSGTLWKTDFKSFLPK